MATAIAVVGLSKRYRIGELQASYGTLRDSLVRTARRVASGPHRHHHDEIWALQQHGLTNDPGCSRIRSA